MARVFISHSSRDNAIAAEIKTWLEGRGFEQVFLDIDKHAGIPPGADWERELYRKIESAQAVILVVTPDWHDSKWCFVEFAQARALGKPIFPLIVAPCGERYIAADVQQLDLQRDRAGGLDRLASELTRIALDAQAGFGWDRARPPYPGLLSFEADDAAVFFGRDDDIRRLIEHLNARRIKGGIQLLALLGASGSGKSSVLRAGVLPRLRRDTKNWVVLPPFRSKRDPVTELARAVSESLGQPQDWRTWRDRLQADDCETEIEDLADALRLRAGERDAHILVTIDQAEELFTVASPEASKAFFRLLKHLTDQHAPFVVLLALRSDYLDRLQDAAQELRLDEILLGPFPPGRIRQIIEGPARVAGLAVDEELVTRAVADVGRDDALPLLAFTLRELYDRFGGQRGPQGGRDVQLSLAHYQALGDPAAGLNPLENAVRKRADEVIDGLKLSEEELGAVREAFVGAMVRIDEEGQYVRRPAQWDDLPALAQPALQHLADARLLVIRNEDGVRTVEVAHEALLRKWPRLNAWLDAERDFLVGKAQLRYSVDDWERAEAGQKDAALLRELPLSRARQWLLDHPRAFTPKERSYLEASIARDDAETRRQVRRRRAMLYSVMTVAAVFAGLSVALFMFWRDANAARLRAESTSLAVQAQSLLADDPVGAAELAARAVRTSSSAVTQSVLLDSVLALSPHLLKVLRVPELQPSAVVWSPDSATVAVAGESGGILRWRPSRPRARAVTTIDHGQASDGVRSRVLALSWRGNRLAAVQANGRVILVDQAGERVMATGNLPSRRLSRAVAGADGRRFVVALADAADTRLFECGSDSDLASSRCTGSSILSGNSTALALHDERSVAAIGIEGGRLHTIQLATPPTPLGQFSDAGSNVASLAWSHDARHVAVGTVDGRTVVLDERGTKIAEGPDATSSVSALAWDPRNARFAAACVSNAICIWQLVDGDASLRPVARLSGHTGVVRAIDWAPDGRAIASASDDGTVRLWSVDSVDRTVSSLEPRGTGTLTDVGVSADQQLLAAGDDNGEIHLWNLPGFALTPTAPKGVGAQIKHLAWAPRGSMLAVADDGGQISLRDGPNDKTGKTLPSEGPIEALVWSPDATAVITSGGLDNSIEARPIEGGRWQVFDGKHPEVVAGLAVDRAGSRLISADALGNVWLWDVATRKRLDWQQSSERSRDTVALSHDGQRVLVAGNEGDVRVYRLDRRTQDPVRCQSNSRQLDSAVFGPRDGLVVAIDPDAVLHIWSLKDGCELFASASLKRMAPSADRSVNLTAYRPRLVYLPQSNLLAVVASTRRVALISLDPATWLARAVNVVGMD